MAWAAKLRIEDTDAHDGRDQSPDGRDASRHRLFLDARASTGSQAAEILIHNLSSTGMLLETSIDLAANNGFDVDIPEVGTVHAGIIWNSETFYGCQFEQPLSRAAVSAALLRSPSDWAASAPLRLPPVATTESHTSKTRHRRESGEISLRAKFFIITGLAIVSWAAVIALAGLVALLF
jgi:hypothetical protein